MKTFIHRNPYARGLGAWITKEGAIIFHFWLWQWSGCVYFGERIMHDEMSRLLRQANDRIAELEARLKPL